jgi:hypothetical protein
MRVGWCALRQCATRQLGGSALAVHTCDPDLVSFVEPGHLAGIPCNCLLDSGATRTHVSHEFARKHAYTLLPCQPHTVLTVAGQVTIQHETHAMLTLGGPDRAFSIEAYVCHPLQGPFSVHAMEIGYGISFPAASSIEIGSSMNVEIKNCAN